MENQSSSFGRLIRKQLGRKGNSKIESSSRELYIHHFAREWRGLILPILYAYTQFERKNRDVVVLFGEPILP